MSLFSQTITQYCLEPFYGEALNGHEDFTVVINSELSKNRRVMILETYDGRVMAVLTPVLARKLAISQHQNLSELDFDHEIERCGCHPS